MVQLLHPYMTTGKTIALPIQTFVGEVALQSPLSTGILQARILEWFAMPASRDLPNPGIEPRSPALQVDSLPSVPPGKPMNTRVGSLSLLQGIFPTQKLNRGLLHCRRILYQLSHQGILQLKQRPPKTEFSGGIYD